VVVHIGELGRYMAPGHPIRFSATPVQPGKGTPKLGADNERLLAEAGYSAQDIAGLKDAGVVR
jgi:crotonobetainyl-CoA:carnitine CoA-transferase CaiB-like acyl-CoA transferase